MVRPFLLFLFVVLPGPAFAAIPSEVDRIVAVVNEDVVTESELEARLPAIRKQLSRQRVRMPPDEVLRKGVLDRMVLERLQLQAAARQGIEATDAKIDQTVRQVAQENRMDVAQFETALKQEGLNMAQFREEVRTRLIIQQLLEREINSRVTVSDSEVANFLARNPGAGAEIEYNISHILIAVPESANPETIQKAKARADTLLAQLKAGAEFEQLAIANSQDVKALEAGNLGWKKAGQLPSLFLSSVEKLKPGEISDVVRSPNGFHILKLNDRRGAAAEPITQTRARHILIRPNELLPPTDARRKLEQLRERIENGADFAAVARANSDDPGSAANGGDLGWISPGQTVPEFERAMNELAVNALSEPVRSPFGYHLIQVLGRRQQDVTEERTIASARSQIHARKADERYDQWLRQLRDEAYVEYKVN